MDKKDKLYEAINLIKNHQWEEAHELVQAYEGDYLFDSIHALLHRQEGDAFNADWWYKRLGKRVPTMGIEEELAQIEEEILKN